MKKTRIVATMGPACDDENVLTRVIEAGVNVARFNFSHGSHEEQKERIDRLKRVREKLNVNVAIMLDTKGPEIRIGTFEEKEINLKSGDKFTLCCYETIGTSEKVSVTYKNLYNELKPGNEILIDDGLVKIIVEEIKDKDIICCVVNEGTLSNNKSINIPGVDIELPGMTEKDKEDILFGIENGVDFIAASFIRSKEDVLTIKNFLKEHNASHIMVISKIENRKGVINLDEILKAGDGLMVARGDLGVEIPPWEVPVVQKRMIKECNALGKPVITATQMLDSMIRNPRPTRAEVADVANAVFDGSDAVMLSGETAAGAYPVLAVQFMSDIVTMAEKESSLFRSHEGIKEANISDAICYSSFKAAALTGAKTILTPTTSGYTARMVSSFRPDSNIIALSGRDHVINQLMLSYGVTPVKIEEKEDFEELLEECIAKAKEKKLIKSNDTVIITAGLPTNTVGTTNTIRIEVIK